METVTKTSTTQKYAAVQSEQVSDATRVTATGAGLQRGYVNKETTFTVDTSNAGMCGVGMNSLQVALVCASCPFQATRIVSKNSFI